jgi:S-adenosylmethionine hydrolase
MIVTLLTDFGLQDEYVGVMKGVILGINRSARLVDLCHQVPPGDIVRAGWLLAWAWRYFPRGTVHVLVVDPGVGSSRKILLLEHQGHRFLAPDNGVLSFLLSGVKNPTLYSVTHRRYALAPISNTFHGRDIFAPAAGYLSKGLSPHRLGPRIRQFKRLKIPEPKALSSGRWVGQVIDLDRFGNAVTNLPGSLVTQLSKQGRPTVRVKGRSLKGALRSYDGVGGGLALAIVGSRSLLEIAVIRGSAAKRLGLKKGDRVEIQGRRAG